jgi:hypothetical protein
MNRTLNSLLLALCAANVPTAHAFAADAPCLVIDSPAKGQLQEGAAVIKFHTEHLQLSPEFGDAALARRPALGHLHVRVDDNKWFWIHASAEPIIIAGLAPGQHKVAVQLADPNHQVLDVQDVVFSMASPPAPK